jgi:probable addiction module antidote protein
MSEKEKVKIKEWSIYDTLVNDTEIIGYINYVAENEPDFLPTAISSAIKAFGINEMVKKTGIKRESLYNAFSTNGNPTYKTLQALLTGLGFELSIKQKTQA